MCCGSSSADSGVINVFGTDITKIDTNELNEIRVRIGFLFKRSIIRFHERTRKFGIHTQGCIKELSSEEVENQIKEILENVG
jgi:phospholipid/cholesterol/gamma-HCH transport system ATP-binding protein